VNVCMCLTLCEQYVPVAFWLCAPRYVRECSCRHSWLGLWRVLCMHVVVCVIIVCYSVSVCKRDRERVYICVSHCVNCAFQSPNCTIYTV